MFGEDAQKYKVLWQTPSGKLTLVSVVVAIVVLLLLLVQGIFFADVLTGGGWVLRLELLCVALAGVFGGHVAEWMEYREDARAARELARTR